MKLVHIYLFKFLAGITLLLMFVGCTHKSTNVIPTLQIGSPLKGVGSKTFAFKDFKDIRGTDASVVTTDVGPSAALAGNRLDQPVATVVAMSIRKELERNGHKCVEYSAQSNPDFIIEGTVYQYWLTERSGLLYATMIGNAGVQLTISRAYADREVLARSYQGEYHHTYFADARGVFKIVLNQALAAMVNEMSTDPELIAFLNEAPEAKPTPLGKEITNVGPTSKKELPPPEKEVSKDRPPEREKLALTSTFPKLPIPEYQISPPPANATPELQALLGKWQGYWNTGVAIAMVFTKVYPEERRVECIYALGYGGPNKERKPTFRRLNANLTPGPKPEIKYRLGNGDFTFTMEGKLLYGTRKSKDRVIKVTLEKVE